MNRIDELLQEANDDAKPSAADLDRVKQGLDAKLFGAGVAGAALVTKSAIASKAAASVAPKAVLFAWKWIGLALMGIGAAGGIMVVAASSREPQEHAAQTGRHTPRDHATAHTPNAEGAMDRAAATNDPSVDGEGSGVDKRADEIEKTAAPGIERPVVGPLSHDPGMVPHEPTPVPQVTQRRTAAARTTATNEAPPAANVTSSPAAPTTVREKERLAEETALVREMGSALAKGDHPRAILLAEEHTRQFPSGLLRDEREAARSIAQCKMGLHDKGEIFRRYVRVVASDTSYVRVKEACSGSTP